MGKPPKEGLLSVQHQRTCHDWAHSILPDAWKTSSVASGSGVQDRQGAKHMSSCEYALELQQTLERAYDRVRQTTGAKQQLQKRLYDQRVHGELYHVGDHVWLHTTVLARNNTRKLHLPWTGPYRVVKRLTDSTYRIQLSSNPRKRLVVHFDRLKPCSTGA